MEQNFNYFSKALILLEQKKQQSKRKNKIIFEIRKKYSIDDELAILRQKDTKPEEFQEYFEFVENIKNNLTKEEEKEVN